MARTGAARTVDAGVGRVTAPKIDIVSSFQFAKQQAGHLPIVHDWPRAFPDTPRQYRVKSGIFIRQTWKNAGYPPQKLSKSFYICKMCSQEKL
jgi:hypothetical protein